MERTAWRRCALRTLASRGGCRRTGGRVVVAARPARGRRRPHLAVHVHIVGRLHDVQYGALGRADVHIRPYLDFGRKRKRSGSHGHLRGAERAPRHGGQGERGGDANARCAPRAVRGRGVLCCVPVAARGRRTNERERFPRWRIRPNSERRLCPLRAGEGKVQLRVDGGSTHLWRRRFGSARFLDRGAPWAVTAAHTPTERRTETGGEGGETW